MLRKIKFKEFKDLYRKHIVKDFPKDERPNLKRFRKRMLEKKEETYIFEEEGIAMGYCIIDEIQEYVLVAFLAVFENKRGKGIGTKILKEIENKYQNKKGILLEVEDPDFSKSEEENKLRQRRIHFYERANFKIVEDLKIKLFGVNFRIMVSGKNFSNTQEIREEMKYFYGTILNKKKEQFLI